MANTVAVDTQLSLLLYRMAPVALRKLMAEIAKYISQKNISRINAQKNTDGSAYKSRISESDLKAQMRMIEKQPDSKNKRKILAQYTNRTHINSSGKMLIGYTRRIREKLYEDHVIVGIFGKPGIYSKVHDKGWTERGIKYPARNILALPDADKRVILAMIQRQVAG